MTANHRIIVILEHLREAVARLEEKQQLAIDECLRSWSEQDIVEREQEKAVQACLDAGVRMIAMKQWERPDDNHGIFDVLAAHDVIESGLAQPLKELVGLRNILAHEYRNIRDEEVYHHLQNATAVLRSFAGAVARAECE